MSVTTNTPAAPFGAITIYRLVRAGAGIAEAARSWVIARRTRRILARLSDEILDDIGLTRADI